MIVNFKGLIIKEKGKYKFNGNSFYWIFMIPVLLPLMLWVSALIIDKAGWIKGMFLISFPLLVLGLVINSKEGKIGILIGGIMTFLIGLSIFSLFPKGVLI